MKSIRYIAVRCPECNSRETCTYQTFRHPEISMTERWHRCKGCGALFKSLEENPKKSLTIQK